MKSNVLASLQCLMRHILHMAEKQALTWTAILFSYRDRIWPTVYAVSSGSRTEVEGRFPVKVLWGMSESGTFSARSSLGRLAGGQGVRLGKEVAHELVVVGHHLSLQWHGNLFKWLLDYALRIVGLLNTIGSCAAMIRPTAVC